MLYFGLLGGGATGGEPPSVLLLVESTFVLFDPVPVVSAVNLTFNKFLATKPTLPTRLA